MTRLQTFLLSGMPSHLASNLGLLLLRLMVAVPMAATHGWKTMMGLFGNGGEGYPDPLGLGSTVTSALMGFSELVCTSLIALGLFTRFSAMPLVIGFLVAVFAHHWGDPYGVVEKAWLYLAAYTVILLLGPGRYSLDGLLFYKKRGK